MNLLFIRWRNSSADGLHALAVPEEEGDPRCRVGPLASPLVSERIEEWSQPRVETVLRGSRLHDPLQNPFRAEWKENVAK